MVVYLLRLSVKKYFNSIESEKDKLRFVYVLFHSVWFSLPFLGGRFYESFRNVGCVELW